MPVRFGLSENSFHIPRASFDSWRRTGLLAGAAGKVKAGSAKRPPHRTSQKRTAWTPRAKPAVRTGIWRRRGRSAHR